MDPAGRRRCERAHNLPGWIAAALLRATLHLAINLSLFVQSQTEPNSLDSWNKITKKEKGKEKKLKSTGEGEINKINQSAQQSRWK